MSDRRGSVLVLSYLVLMLFSTWTATGLLRSTTELHASQLYVEKLQAFHAAEAGLDDAHVWLRGRGIPPSGVNPFDPFNGPRPVNRGRVRVTIDPDDNNPTRYVDLFTITATGDVNSSRVTRRITKLLRTESFARYAYFTDSELLNGWPIWFTSRDYLGGPVHTNDQLNIAGSPVFDGPVTSAASSIHYMRPPPSGGNSPRFNGGVMLSAGVTRLPLSVTQLRVAASSAGGAWYTGNTLIKLQPDGTMLVTNPLQRWVDRPQPLPANGAIFVNGGNVTVSGTLDGQLTIGTNRDLVIANDIRYANDPVVDPQSNDVLGLVAEQNVIVSQTAPSDLTVHASIMALNSSFTVANWWVGPPKGTLRLYGGVIQKSRGPVGTFSRYSGLKLSGYTKDYRYDTRLSGLAPPFYPTTAQYEEILWQEND